MPTCCVPYCDTGYPSAIKRNKEKGIRNPHMFSIPRDDDIFKIWKNKIKRKDRVLRRSDKVCSIHFKDDDINRYYETKLKDGSVFKMERGKPCLREGAVPRIFPQYPLYYSGSLKERKLPYDRSTSINKSELEVMVTEESVFESHIHSTAFTFDNVVQFARNIGVPKWEFLILTTCNIIMFMQLDDIYQSLKRIIISDLLAVEIYIGNVKVCIEHNLKRMEDLLALLNTIDGMNPCPEARTMSTSITSLENPMCRGFMTQKSKRCAPYVCRNRLKDNCTQRCEAVSKRNWRKHVIRKKL